MLASTQLDGDLDSPTPELTFDDAYSQLVERNPALRAARARADQARVLIERARRTPIPNVDVFVSVRRQDLTHRDIANVQVGVPAPIFNRNQGNIQAAEAEWIAASREVQRLELELQDGLAVAYRRYANARQQAERYRQSIIPKAERSLHLVTRGYDQGQIDYLPLLIAQQTYIQTTVAYVDALRELNTATAVIEGQLLTGSLSNVGESSKLLQIANCQRRRYDC